MATNRRASTCNIVGLFLTACFAAVPIHAEPADRVTQAVDATKVRVLPNHVPAWANANNLVGPVPANSMLDQMTIVLARSPEQEQELAALSGGAAESGFAELPPLADTYADGRALRALQAGHR